MSQYHNLREFRAAQIHAAVPHRDLLAEAERDRLAVPVRRRSLAGGLSAALARVATRRARRVDAPVAAPRSAAAA